MLEPFSKVSSLASLFLHTRQAIPAASLHLSDRKPLLRGALQTSQRFGAAFLASAPAKANPMGQEPEDAGRLGAWQAWPRSVVKILGRISCRI